MTPHAVITGASAGIGAAIAALLGRNGWRLSLGARRVDRLPRDAYAAHLDVTDEASVARFLEGARAAHGGIDVLINNAGKAKGLAPLAEADPAHWREMVETNVMGVLHVTRAVLPEMIRRGSGHVVMIGSIAGHETYEKGGVYCATKRALQAITEAIRLETLGTGVRVTSVDPGLVETEFSVVRFDGDKERAAKVYADTRPLTADDVAECVWFALSRPAHVNVDLILVKPTDQASVGRVHRRA
ncbi:MAG TPA: SDR family NAD(P)-dependent oxidoreductase [Planctomycetota bacterium]|nr:SDR family NAD(P)-dependent oxidoreductase [Planctomycetota bacterium]